MDRISKDRRLVNAVHSAIEQLEARVFFSAVNVGINTGQTFQTIEGFGAAMTPWDLKPEYQDPKFFDTIVNDLGTTMARAAILPTAETKNDDADPNHINFAAFDSNSLSMPFEFFKALQDRGVGKFVGSVWTAPAWMKTNQIYTDGGELRPDERGEFAEYLSAVAQIARNDYGVNLSAISPQNEPYFVEPYESTTYNNQQLRETVRSVMRRFNSDGLSTKILLPEDLIFEDRNAWYVNAIMNDPETKNFNGAFAGHGLTGHWTQLRDTLAPFNREFWMTETSGNSPTWEGAIGVANSIMSAIGDANASAYLYWQFSESSANAKWSLMIDGQPTPKYYAAKQFFRYIRPGMVHVGTTSSDSGVRVASFRDSKTGAMTTVILNTTGDADDITLDLSGGSAPGSYRVYRSSSSENMASLGTITGGSHFTMNVPGLSIVTITNVAEPTVHTAGSAVAADAVEAKTSDFVSQNSFFDNAMKGYNDSLTKQIAGGADVNQVASNGWTPLMSAAASPRGGSINTLQNLIDHGASVTVRNNEGWTPLHAAAANTFTKNDASKTMQADKITALINAGADVNARDNNGRTALMWAGWMGAYLGFTEDPSVINALLAKGADPFLKDNFGKTALDYAKSEGYSRQVVDALVKAMGLDKTKPSGDVVDVSPDPRATSVTDFTINFSERVLNFDLTDITLTRNGVAVDLPSGAALTANDDQHFQLSGMGGTTAAPGTYVITVSVSDITDPSGNALAAAFSDTWTLGNTPPPPDQTPFHGTPFKIGKSLGTTTIQFEDFDNGGEAVAYHDTDSTNNGKATYRTSAVDIQTTSDTGGGYNVGYTKVGEWLEYTIHVNDTGAYDFNFRLASTGSNGKFHVAIDSADVTGALTVPNTAGYQTWKTLTKSGVNLTAGDHVLRIALDTASSNGSVGNFNYFTVAPSTGNPPPPDQTPFHGTPFAVGSTPATIQAEDFDNGGEGIAYHDTDAANNGGQYRTTGVDLETTGDAGGGYHVAYAKAGEWLEYTINVSQAGTYGFDFRVASKGLGGKFHASIDGTDKTGQLQVPDTGGWNAFKDVTKTGVSLSAGQHILRLTFDTVGGSTFAGNFNWMKVTLTSSNPTGTTLTNSTSAYVRGGTSAALNFGSDPTLVVKKHTDPSSTREAYLKFDLSPISTINSAKLRLFGALNDTSSTSVQTQVFGGAGTSWDESTLTWNTRPATTGSALSTITVTGTAKQWYELDLTSFLKAEKAAGHNTVTLVLKNPTQQNALIVFNSDDASGNKPQLVIS